MHGYEVNLEQWTRTLHFFGWFGRLLLLLLQLTMSEYHFMIYQPFLSLFRWSKCKAFGPHVRKLQAGSLAPSSVCRCSERLLPSPVHPDVMRGVKVASVAWFILRIPREELACEDLRPGLVACAV